MAGKESKWENGSGKKRHHPVYAWWCLTDLKKTHGLGASGSIAIPLFGLGASGNIAIPLLGLGASGSIAIPLFGRGASGSIAIPLRLPPANEIAKFVAAIARIVNIRERNRLLRVDIANPPLLWVVKSQLKNHYSSLTCKKALGRQGKTDLQEK